MKLRIQPRLEEFGVSRVNSVTWLDRLGYPVYQAVRPLSRNLSVSQGKGRTIEQAWISAAMESIELACAQEPAVDRHALPARALDLPYPVDALTLERHSLWHADLPIDWTPATVLLTGDEIAVPHEAVAVDFTGPEPWAPPTFRPSSNGLASGANVDEASLAALLELIERHNLQTAAGMTDRWADGQAVAIDDPSAVGLVGDLDEPLELDVLEIATTLPVATLAVRVWSADLPYWFWGSATDFDLRSAFMGAFGEAVQSRLTMIAAARDDVRMPPLAIPEAKRARGVRLTELLDRYASGPTVEWTPDRAVEEVERLSGWPLLRCILHDDDDFAVVKLLAPGLEADRYPHG
jgi:ribosomal protein S12 methylthiotransferase accessory factor